MGARQPAAVVPGNPTQPTQAQPDEGGPSQDQAQQMADKLSQALGSIVDQMKKILDVLQKMGIDDKQLSEIATHADNFIEETQEALGLKPQDSAEEEQQEGEEGQSGPVPQESGGKGQPAV